MKIFKAQMYTVEVKGLVILNHFDAKFLHHIYLSNKLKSGYFYIAELLHLLKQYFLHHFLSLT